MKRLALALMLLVTASVAHAEDKKRMYDFRKTPQYKALSDTDRERLEIVHRDFTLLWGALDRYADEHAGMAPKSLSDLVPRYLRELPDDAFATKDTAAEQNIRYYIPSKDGYGYRYRQGVKRSWIVSSVGLPDFPYLAKRGNVSLYLPKGTWLSGRQSTGNAVTNAK